MSVSKMKILISLMLAVSIMIIQTRGIFAVSALQTSTTLEGAVQSITIETDTTTGMAVVIVTVLDTDAVLLKVRIDEKTAMDLGLVLFDGDGKLIINNSALGRSVEIKPEMVLPDQGENQHPVGNVLATFFSNIAGLDYDTIMRTHNNGTGFGVIAQALWLTTKLEGNAEVFQALLRARETGDYKEFVLEDDTIPRDWAELRKAILDGKRVKNLGSVMSDQDNGNGNNPDQNQGNNQDKGKEKDKEKDKNKDNGGNGNGNGNSSEKEKEKKK